MLVNKFDKLIGYLPMKFDMFLIDVSIKHIFPPEDVNEILHLTDKYVKMLIIIPNLITSLILIDFLLSINYLSQNHEIRYYQEIRDIKYYLQVSGMEVAKEPINIVYQMYNECLTPIFKKGSTQGNKPVQNPAKRFGDFNPHINVQNINVPFFKQSRDQIVEENMVVNLVEKQFEYPYSAIGLLTYEEEDGQIITGMASHIGENIIMTSANNCFSLKTRQNTSNLLFYPSAGSTFYPALNVYFPEEYKKAVEEENIVDQMRFNYAFIVLDTHVDLDFVIGSVGYNFFSKTRKVEVQSILTYNLKRRTFELESISCGINMGMKTAAYCIDDALTILSGAPIINLVDNYIIVKGIHGNSALNSGVGLCVNLNYEVEMKRLTWLQREYGSLWLQSTQGDYEKGIELLSEKKKGMSCLHVKNECLTASSVELMTHAKWNYLENINFRNNKIDNDILLQISEGKWPRLTKLDLSYNIIKLERKILENINWKALRHLDLQSNKLSGTSIKYLIIPSWKRLTQLRLGSNLIDVEGARHLISSNWPSLNVLSLLNNKLIDKALPYLIKANWPELTSLQMQGNTFTYYGLISLLKMMELRLKKQTLSIQISNIQTSMRSEKNNFLALMKAKSSQITFKIE